MGKGIFDIKNELISLLTVHVPYDISEGKSLERTIEWLRIAADPLNRECFVPGHVTASAFVVSSENDKVCLIYHTAVKAWLQPGGHVEPGEVSLVEVAAREASEEIGLAVSSPKNGEFFDIDVHQIPKKGELPAHLHFDFRFLFYIEDLRPMTAPSEALEIRWVTYREGMELGLDPGLIRMFNKALQGNLSSSL